MTQLWVFACSHVTAPSPKGLAALNVQGISVLQELQQLQLQLVIPFWQHQDAGLSLWIFCIFMLLRLDKQGPEGFLQSSILLLGWYDRVSPFKPCSRS